MTTEAQKRACKKYQETKTRIVVWCDPKEKEQIEKKATEAGMSVTQFIKDVALNK